MQLNEDTLDAWARVTCPDGRSFDDYLLEAREQLRDPRWAARHRVRLDDDGRLVAFAWLTEHRPGHLALWGPRIRGEAVSPADAALIGEAVDQARAEGARFVEGRLSLHLENEVLVQALTASGGVRHGGRIEYRAPISGLPGEDVDSPLVWRAGAVDRATAGLLAATADGPDALWPGEDPLDTLRHWLSDPERTNDPAACLHVGALDGRDVALAVAQVVPSDAWSTCTWLGLVPESRGRGLGNVLHRHGIAMLRAQGGQVYHGGTSLENAPMRACFARQGCAELRRFAVWRWSLGAPSWSSEASSSSLRAAT